MGARWDWVRRVQALRFRVRSETEFDKVSERTNCFRNRRWSASDWPLYVMNLVVAVCAQTSMPEPNRNRNEGSRRISPLPPSSLASERYVSLLRRL